MSDTIFPILFLNPESHPKAWGEEIWWVNNDKYCAKSLRFLAGKEFSNHYHWIKEETWICVSGELLLEYYNLTNADKLTKTIKPGDIIHIPPGNPHKLKAITDAVIWEVSSRHEESDSYRIGKGSSQQSNSVSNMPFINSNGVNKRTGRPYVLWSMGSEWPWPEDVGRRIRVPKRTHDPSGAWIEVGAEGVIKYMSPVTCAWAARIKRDDGSEFYIDQDAFDFVT